MNVVSVRAYNYHYYYNVMPLRRRVRTAAGRLLSRRLLLLLLLFLLPLPPPPPQLLLLPSVAEELSHVYVRYTLLGCVRTTGDGSSPPPPPRHIGRLSPPPGASSPTRPALSLTRTHTHTQTRAHGRHVARTADGIIIITRTAHARGLSLFGRGAGTCVRVFFFTIFPGLRRPKFRTPCVA